MNSFILNLKMELAKAKKDAFELETKIKRCFCELNAYCIPYFKNPREIKAEEIEQIGDELITLKNALIDLREKTADLKEQLGED